MNSEKWVGYIKEQALRMDATGRVAKQRQSKVQGKTATVSECTGVVPRKCYLADKLHNKLESDERYAPFRLMTTRHVFD
jgi:hypothetical protein